MGGGVVYAGGIHHTPDHAAAEDKNAHCLSPYGYSDEIKTPARMAVPASASGRGADRAASHCCCCYLAAPFELPVAPAAPELSLLAFSSAALPAAGALLPDAALPPLELPAPLPPVAPLAAPLGLAAPALGALLSLLDCSSAGLALAAPPL